MDDHSQSLAQSSAIRKQLLDAAKGSQAMVGAELAVATAVLAYFLPMQRAVDVSLWYVALAVTGALRVALTHYFARSPRTLSQVVLVRYKHLLAVISGLAGIAWGSSATLITLRATDSHLENQIVVFLVAMIIHGFLAAVLLSPTPRSALAFIFSATPLYLLLLASNGSQYDLMPAAIIVSVVGMVFSLLLLRQCHRYTLKFSMLEQDYRTLLSQNALNESHAKSSRLATAQFFAAASHDLRQPMHAFGLLIGSLRGAHNDSARKYIVDKMELLLKSTDRMFSALLDIGKADSGVLTPEISIVHIDGFLHKIASEFSSVAENNRVRLTVRKTTCVTQSDPTLLGQIVRNLISNAISVTQSGRVVIGCRRGRGESFKLIVCDTGPGIPAEDLQRIFTPYAQIDGTERSGPEHYGLGLAIVQRFCTVLGIRLEVASIVGRGSQFSLVLPSIESSAKSNIQLVSNRQRLPLRQAFLSGKRGGVIDDAPEILEATAELLGSWGCDPTIAANASDFFHRLSVLPKALDFAIVDLDLGQGTEDGLDAMRRLRAMYGDEFPILIVTAASDGRVIEQMRADGVPVLQKPVRAARLRGVLLQLLS